MIKWDETYKVGEKNLDLEHQQLFGLLDVVRNYPIKDQEYLKKIISTLKDYIRIHFTHEEELLVKCGYEHLDEHKKTHHEFIQKVLEFEKNYLEKDEKVQARMVEFLKSWLASHILIEDKAYENKLKEYISGLSENEKSQH